MNRMTAIQGGRRITDSTPRLQRGQRTRFEGRGRVASYDTHARRNALGHETGYIPSVEPCSELWVGSQNRSARGKTHETVFEGLPIFTRGPGLPPTPSRRGTPLSRANWIKRFLSTRRSKHDGSDFLCVVADPIDGLIEPLALFHRSGLVPTNPDAIQEDPANTPPAVDMQQSPPALAPYETES